MVVLRLKRMGRIHHPFYRLSAMDKRSPRDGRVIENLGWFSPTAEDGKQWNLHLERVQYWLGVGAQPSITAATLIRKAGGSLPKGVIEKLDELSKSVKTGPRKSGKEEAKKA